jgi:predicted DsbA family dithiol-disulfide isomerase
MRPELLIGIAASAGLDPEAAQAQLLAPQTTGVLNQDRVDVETVGVRQTPTFFVNGRPLDQFGEAELRRLVAAEVSAANS